MNKEKKLYGILALVSSGELGLYEAVAAISELDEEQTEPVAEDDVKDKDILDAAIWLEEIGISGDTMVDLDMLQENPDKYGAMYLHDLLDAWIKSHPQESAQERYEKGMDYIYHGRKPADISRIPNALKIAAGLQPTKPEKGEG